MDVNGGRKKIVEWIPEQKLFSQSEEINGKVITVSVEKNRPVFEGDRPEFVRNGKVSICLVRGNLRVFFSASEAEALSRLLAMAVPVATNAERENSRR